jgi:hypothetical protein
MRNNEQEGVFPISDCESDVLHDLGWCSGFGWKEEWDWWHVDTPEEQHMESRDWDTTKLRLYEHIASIRQARKQADSIIANHFRRLAGKL